MVLKKDDKKQSSREIAAKKTKQRVYNAAKTLFLEHGFDTVTIEDITRAAGVSKGTFYVHFKNKETVLLHYFRQIDDLYQASYDTLPEFASMKERILLLVDCLADYCMNVLGLDALKIIYCNQISKDDPKVLRDTSRTIYLLFADALKHGAESGELVYDEDQAQLVEYLVSQGRSMLYDWCLYNGSFDLKEKTRSRYSFITKFLTTKFENEI